jgi:hypothetical protein
VSDALGFSRDERNAPFDSNGVVFQEPIGKIA